MSGLSPQEERRIVQAIRSGDISDALVVLEDRADLLARDLPRVKKSDLDAVASSPGSLHQLIVAVCSPCAPVRRFSQRLLRHLGEPASEELLLAALEAVDANRPLEECTAGCLGNFEGYPSPIGARIAAGPGTAAGSGRSTAMAYGLACAQSIAQALAALDLDSVVVLREYLEVIAVGGADRRPWATSEGAIDMMPLLMVAVGRALDRKVARGDERACDSILAWAARHPLIFREQAPTKALELARERSRALGDAACAAATRGLRTIAAKTLGVVAPEMRRRLYEKLALTSLEAPGSIMEEAAIVARLQHYAGRFQKDGPHLELPVLEARLQLARLESRLEELKSGKGAEPPARGWSMRVRRRMIQESQDQDDEQEGRRKLLELDVEAARAALQREKTKRVSRQQELESARPPPPVRSSSRPHPTSRACPRGPSTELVTRAILALSRTLGYPRLWWQAVQARHLRGSYHEADAPAQSESEDALQLEGVLEGLLEAALDSNVQMRRSLPLPPEHEFLDRRAFSGPHLPEAQLTGAAWGPALLGAILESADHLRDSFPPAPPEGESGSASPEQVALSALILAGITLLPVEEVEALADWCQRHLEPGRVFHHGDHLEPALDLFRQRRVIVAEMQLFLIAHYPRLRFNLEGQRAVAALYHHGVRGRELVLAVIRALPLPRSAESGRGIAWKQPWQKMLWDAWSGGDLELLVAALERCAVQTVTSSGELLLPRLPLASEHLPTADEVPEQGGIPLPGLWEKLRADAPECLSGILASMVQCADADPLPTQLLLVACREEKLTSVGTRLPVPGLLELLDSPDEAAASAALEIVSRCPGFLSGHLTQATDVLSRLTRGASIRVAVPAVRVLGTLASRHPQERPSILQELSAALGQERPEVVSEVLRSMVGVFQATETAGGPPCEIEAPATAPPVPELSLATRQRVQQLAAESPAMYGKLVDELLAIAGEQGAPR